MINELLYGPGGSAAQVQRVESSRNEAAREFKHQMEEQLAVCRRLVNDSGRAVEDEDRLPLLAAMRSPVRKLASLASAEGKKAPAYVCEALEALLAELEGRPDRLNASTIRTVFQTVDFLFEVFDPELKFELSTEPAFQILVVDDDTISRRAVLAALRRIGQTAVECESTFEALQLTAEQKYDLIFLDMEMPEMSGADLCARIRYSETNRATPVIFVTGHTDLQTRAQSTLSGGNDFIGKPFHFMELAVKALLHLLRSQRK